MLADKMKEILATSFALYLKAHNYHWNVTGPNFAQYHDFFGQFYLAVHASIDTTAEEIRKLDSFAPGSMVRFLELSAISDETMVPSTAVMFSRLATDNEKLLTLLYEARNMADESDSIGTLAYLENMIGVHEKHAWMLKSFG